MCCCEHDTLCLLAAPYLAYSNGDGRVGGWGRVCVWRGGEGGVGVVVVGLWWGGGGGGGLLHISSLSFS